MDSTQYYNPYSGQNFFGFFMVLLQRLWMFLCGNLSFQDLATDEIQLLVLMGVAASAALVGSFLVLRKMTMLANSLSHTILLGIVGAYLLMRFSDSHEALSLQSMLVASILTGLFTAFLTEFLTKTARLQEDASTGIVFTSLFALGIVLLTLLTRNVHIGIEVVMGNVDGLQREDLKLVFLILGMNLLLFFLFFKEFKITTFDSALARSFGLSTVFFNYLLMTQVSATVISAFRAVGVLMVLSFITGPALTARLLTHDLKRMLLLAVLLGCLASLLGVAISRHLLSVYGIALSTGGLVVCAISLLFLAAVLIKKAKRHSSFLVKQA
jgi:manganese/zinc/iron transport system permease protein